MRHIQIKILTVIVTIFLSISSYGQMQQVLKNGFVAATDSGVYYLQDGFSEWVRFGGINNSLFWDYERDLDTITGITYNDGVLMIFYVGNNITTEGKTSYNKTILYGDKLQEPLSPQNTVGYYTVDVTPKNITNKFKRGSKGGSVYYDIYSKDRLNMSKNGIGSNFYNFIDYPHWQSMTTDQDTILCWVGTNNILYKCILAEQSIDRTQSSISGLHSRPTDSHQICYNPDDDEFIIVSDSGIVYSYDKTTVTTLDTINTSPAEWSPNVVSSVLDVEYLDNKIFMMVRLSNDSLSAVVCELNSIYDNSSKIILGPSSGLKGISKTNDRFVYFYTYYGVDYVSVITLNTTATDVESLKRTGTTLKNRTIFDLDYINYMP